MALKFNSVILLKTGVDIVTDGVTTYLIQGGNPGLTKGGTGDILAGVNVALYSKNDPLSSAVASSLLTKRSADQLGRTEGVWFNNRGLLNDIPRVMNALMRQYNPGYKSVFLVDMKGKIK
jgi:NAD(P)H-hydrate epimerase